MHCCYVGSSFIVKVFFPLTLSHFKKLTVVCSNTSRKSSDGRFVIGAFFSSLLNVCNTRRRSEIIYNKPELGKRESLATQYLVQRLLL